MATVWYYAVVQNWHRNLRSNQCRFHTHTTILIFVHLKLFLMTNVNSSPFYRPCKFLTTNMLIIDLAITFMPSWPRGNSLLSWVIPAWWVSPRYICTLQNTTKSVGCSVCAPTRAIFLLDLDFVWLNVTHVCRNGSVAILLRQRLEVFSMSYIDLSQALFIWFSWSFLSWLDVVLFSVPYCKRMCLCSRFLHSFLDGGSNCSREVA